MCFKIQLPRLVEQLANYCRGNAILSPFLTGCPCFSPIFVILALFLLYIVYTSYIVSSQAWYNKKNSI